MAAQGLGCLPEAIIVVAMLSSEAIFAGNSCAPAALHLHLPVSM